MLLRYFNGGYRNRKGYELRLEDRRSEIKMNNGLAHWKAVNPKVVKNFDNLSS